jgi:hypothetical protein
LPIREGRYSAIIVHFWAPTFSTSCIKIASSSWDHWGVLLDWWWIPPSSFS